MMNIFGHFFRHVIVINMFKKEKKVEGMLSVDENELSRRAIRRLIDDMMMVM